MPLFEIKCRFTGVVRFSLECENAKACVEAGVKAGADLEGADLEGANLRGADLQGADLRGADLRGAYLGGADLEGADLQGAYLRGADLRGADLRGADLRGADLQGAYLQGADLRGANVNWQSHDILAEILRQDAGADIKRRSFAGLVLISRDWCWSTWLRLDVTAEVRWAASVLAKWIKPEDSGVHIEAIKQLAEHEIKTETAGV
jgi:uncharacterized protein YjbI with pentapeptide repeats